MNIIFPKAHLNYARLQTIRKNGALYQAEIYRNRESDYSYGLIVYYVDDVGKRHMEFSMTYKTRASVRNKLLKYFKGETTEWEPLSN
ncbi:MAG: hypothetical protein Q4E18_00130 [Clostridia bacterium]|nr:hypothetical protein [Clostridia bacterium]